MTTKMQTWQCHNANGCAYHAKSTHRGVYSGDIILGRSSYPAAELQPTGDDAADDNLCKREHNA